MRNPRWTVDELILALELYFRVNPLHTSETNAEIVALSNLLNKLPIHTNRPDEEKFRNPSGVYMKLCNFLRLDHSYTGKGLDAGSKLDEKVWQEYANDRHRLIAVAQAIIDNHDKSKGEFSGKPGGFEEEEFPEGKILTRLHKLRERNSALTRKKKKEVLASTGKLACEVCGFDFAEHYGELGNGYCECHHIIPVSELRDETKTKLSDLAIVCANCHRMLHRARPWLSFEALRVKMNN